MGGGGGGGGRSGWGGGVRVGVNEELKFLRKFTKIIFGGGLVGVRVGGQGEFFCENTKFSKGNLTKKKIMIFF